MKYIRIKHIDELHPYKSYGWTTFVCCTSYLQMYFIHIQLTNLLHPYVKNIRYTRTPVTQKSQKMCTSGEIKPTPVTLSPPPNRYLSQQCKTISNRRNQTIMIKASIKCKKPPAILVTFKRKTSRGIFAIFEICWVHQQ